MLAYAKYPLNDIKIQCVKRQNEIIDSFYLEKSCVDDKDNIYNFENIILINLQEELKAVNNLLKMCSTLKTYGETTKKYITLDLEYVNLLWPNKL